jgi:polysaccharide export outer membrane protein
MSMTDRNVPSSLRRWFVAALVAALTCLLAAPPAAADISDYRLGSGDRIRLTVYDEPDLSGEFTVNGTGRLSLPLVGLLNAEGLTARELESAIANKLKPDYVKNPDVTVEIMTYRPFYIVGEIKKPGSYPYVDGMTVINAVAVAGGFTYRARESSFDIQRTVNGKTDSLRARPDTQVAPGDVITVHERFFLLFS